MDIVKTFVVAPEDHTAAITAMLQLPTKVIYCINQKLLVITDYLHAKIRSRFKINVQKLPKYQTMDKDDGKRRRKLEVGCSLVH